MKKITQHLFLLFIAFNCLGQSPVAFYPTSQANGRGFGSKIASLNNDVLVSSVSFDLMSLTGKTYLFNLTAGNLVQTEVFYPSDALTSDRFGSSISLNSEFIAIGSPLHDANFEDSGAVYLYRKVAGTWSLFQKITASDAIANNQFGTFVKIHNNQLFISSINYQIGSQDPNSNSGKVYVYSFNGTQWIFNQTLANTVTYKFGEKIEFENNKLVVLSRENSNEFSAKFHTYNFDGITWNFENSTPSLGSFEEKIEDFCLSGNQLFITSVGMSGNKVLIYDAISGNWNLSGNITINQFTDQLFTRLEVNNGNMFIGSTGYVLATTRKFPLLYYKKVGGNWVYQSAFYGTETIAGRDDFFGSEIELSGNNLIIGAPSEGIISLGQAYYLDLFLSNDEFKMEQPIVYPNPTKDFIYLKNSNLQSINSVNVYSITGKLLLSKKESLDKLSLQDLAAGIYFLKINFDNNSNQTLKIIKE